MINFNAGDRVTVVRSNGDIEHDWYLWTDMDMLRADRSFAFTAPELIGLMVLKITDGSTVQELLTPGNQVAWMGKKINLSQLIQWQSLEGN